MKYRPDIDGLRGIAVLSVVFFHIFPARLSGGFIGVDVFFVISGYLISTIIFTELDKGTFSFIDFYSRRIKRIFPALILVLASCICLGWFTLLAEEFGQLGKHAASGAGFISNFVLWSESGYFDNSSDTKPLLHLWSLSVEEQFYLAWPFLMWMSWKKRLNLLTVTLLVAGASFALNLKGIGVNSIGTFYSPQTRIWELLVGSALAWISFHKKDGLTKLKIRITKFINRIIYSDESECPKEILPNLFSIIGITTLVYGLWRINKGMVFPGWWALLPVLSTLLILAAGPTSWINRKILSNKAIVWVGLISFPLYLWHWPILSFFKIFSASPISPVSGTLIIAFSVLLSWGTYYFLELNVRNKLYNRRHIIKIILSAMFLCLIIGSSINLQSGIPGRYKTQINPDFKLPDISAEKCTPVSGVQDSWCWQSTATPKTALIGDSHANQLFASIVYSNHPIFSRLLSLGAGNCPPIEGESERCDLQVKAALPSVLSNTSIKYVFIGSWNIIAGQYPGSKEGFSKLISKLEKSGKKIIFIIDLPTLKFNPSLCQKNPIQIRESIKIFVNKITYCDTVEPQFFEDSTSYNNLVENLKSEFPQVYFYDPRKIFCSPASCRINMDGNIVYRDEGHLGEFGRKIVVDSMIKELSLINF